MNLPATIEIPALQEILERLERPERKIANLEGQIKIGRGKEWYNIQETAQVLNVSTKTVRRLINRRILKRSLGTRNIQVHREDLDNYRKATTYGLD